MTKLVKGKDLWEERSGLCIKYGVIKSYFTWEEPGLLLGHSQSGKQEVALETTSENTVAAKKFW